MRGSFLPATRLGGRGGHEDQLLRTSNFQHSWLVVGYKLLVANALLQLPGCPSKSVLQDRVQICPALFPCITVHKYDLLYDMSTYTVPFIINGEECRTEKSFEVVSPASGEAIHRCGIAGEKEVIAAIDAAAAAGRQWRNTGPSQRRDIFLRAAEIMDKKREELAKYMIDEVGASPDWAGFNLNTAIEMLKDTAGRVASLSGVVPTSVDPSRGSMILREPYGVVLAIAPW